MLEPWGDPSKGEWYNLHKANEQLCFLTEYLENQPHKSISYIDIYNLIDKEI